MAAVEEKRTLFIRPDGKEKVTGLGRYTADMNLTGQLHAKFKYAGHTYARITRIDTSKAEALPGVFAVLTHADVPEVRYGGMCQDRLMFAKDAVRFEADIVAGVAALTEDIAQQAVDLIEVDYEPLPANSDIEAALAPGATLIHEGWADYGGDETMGRDGNTLGHSTIIRGDAATAMDKADAVVKGRYVADCSQGVPIEPRAIIAQWQGDKVTVWSSTQVPFAARSGVATVLEIPESHVRIVVPLLGGGFGSKCDFHFEGHVAALARASQRPVKLVFSRHEEFIAPDHRREGMVLELETGVTKDGTIVARRGQARDRRRRLLRRGRLLRPDGRDARARPVPDPERRHRLVPGLHEQPAVELDPRPHGAAGVLGRRAAHGRGRRGDRDGRRRAAPPLADRGGQARCHRAGLRPDRRCGRRWRRRPR